MSASSHRDSSDRPSTTAPIQTRDDRSPEHRSRSDERPRLKQKKPKHIRVDDVAHSGAGSSASSVNLASYPRSPWRSRLSLDASHGVSTPRASEVGSHRTSVGQPRLDHLLRHVDLDLDTYGVEELRDGFFDATFLPPPDEDEADVLDEAIRTLPHSFRRHDPLSFYYFLPKQWHQFCSLIRRVTQTRRGVNLLKSFLGIFIAYIVCLIPESRAWLGRYNYILVVSATLNHPGRSVGSQIDGTILTILGTLAGLGWGSLALWVSTSTPAAQAGYGGILAAFLIVFTGVLSWLRCVYIRIYQAVIPAGIAICYTCLANTSEAVSWGKLLNYGIPWVLGQAIGLIVSLLVFPSAGARPLAVSLHGALVSMQKALELPRSAEANTFIRRDLSWHFVDLSQAYRDFALEISICRLGPQDVKTLRNLIQRAIKSTLAIKIGITFFGPESAETTDEVTIHIGDSPPSDPTAREAVEFVRGVLLEPTKALLAHMDAGVSTVGAALMDIIGYKNLLQPLHPTELSLPTVLERLRKAQEAFDEADSSLIGHPKIPSTLHSDGQIVDLFLFVHPVRQTADTIEALIVEAMNIQNHVGRSKISLPSYPWKDAFLRNNAQVRHDRGGLTVGFFFQAKRQLDKMMQDLDRSTSAAHPALIPDDEPVEGKLEEEEVKAQSPSADETTRLRYRLWRVLHRLQGFETRFAVKMAILTTLLSIPAWLPQSRDWWNEDDAWWTVVFVWIMMHPRVGGNVQDLITRSLFSIVGSVLGDLSFAAAVQASTPYVLIPFVVALLPPLVYRYTQSSHPRSGILAVLAFLIISLSCLTLSSPSRSTLSIALPRALAFLVGTTSAILVNWVFSPFIARHSLRVSVSTSLIHAGILYRSILSNYIYPPSTRPFPSAAQIEQSEIIESNLRESFVRHRQLLDLTRHEIRLRAPFDPLPWSGLIQCLEAFFDRLVEVRQSSLYFRIYIQDQVEARETGLDEKRRDAIAAVLTNLYVLAGALRAGNEVPRYLPSAAAARKRLLERMEEVGRGVELPGLKVDNGGGRERAVSDTGRRRWADVYQYAYSTALTEIVETVEGMGRFSRRICGERGFDDVPEKGEE